MERLITSLLCFAALFASTQGSGKTLTIAVIDTGIDAASNSKLCKTGHKSFLTQDTDPLYDAHGHGTHVAGLITKEAGAGNYCLIAIKFYSENNTSLQNLTNMVRALHYVTDLNVDYINISGGGVGFSETEFLAINRVLSKGINVVAAAGNEGHNLDVSCNYYPACYSKKIVMVGNLESVPSYANLSNQWKLLVAQIGLKFDSITQASHRASNSNYGKRVTRWEVGTNLLSTLPGGRTGRMSGTSQATAVATGKIVKERLSQ